MIYFSFILNNKNSIIEIIIEIKNVTKVFSIIEKLLVLAAKVILINLPKLSAIVNRKAFIKKFLNFNLTNEKKKILTSKIVLHSFDS